MGHKKYNLVATARTRIGEPVSTMNPSVSDIAECQRWPGVSLRDVNDDA